MKINKTEFLGRTEWLKLREEQKKIAERAELRQCIFNPPATILYKCGKKSVSKCDSEDTFDEEKGLMMCLLKSHGYTYGDIERLLKSAKRFGKKGE